MLLTFIHIRFELFDLSLFIYADCSCFIFDLILRAVCDLCCKGLYRVCEKLRRFQERKRLSLRLNHFCMLADIY